MEPIPSPSVHGEIEEDVQPPLEVGENVDIPNEVELENEGEQPIQEPPPQPELRRSVRDKQPSRKYSPDEFVTTRKPLKTFWILMADEDLVGFLSQFDEVDRNRCFSEVSEHIKAIKYISTHVDTFKIVAVKITSLSIDFSRDALYGGGCLQRQDQAPSTATRSSTSSNRPRHPMWRWGDLQWWRWAVIVVDDGEQLRIVGGVNLEGTITNNFSIDFDFEWRTTVGRVGFRGSTMMMEPSSWKAMAVVHGEVLVRSCWIS
ncbi:hypothetical protein RHGRI_032429 [Rhododendron griersonianum]|uniref:Uncharacterized protein n=1 Tax=Rhododendron griersonianum TaxID=479676 RepID=A0AAV6ICC1_9ERIC|nr:hypothetical protein RHGRI_032429 [Rhododendron griersonianum]